MGPTKKIDVRKKAARSMAQIADYIAGRGFPENARRFLMQLYAFANKLKNAPDAHPICRHRKLAEDKMRCAIFKKNYIFIYRVEKDTVVIYNVIYGRRNPASFSA